jgi:CubicO group peptidase (beta-lactamase class C family)
MNSADGYDVASVTKTFTVALILQLAQEGKLSLDEPLSTYVPGFSHADEVTIRELIQHTSGVISTADLAPDEALAEAGDTPLDFAPGTAFEYSTPGYFLLGLTVEAVTGEPFTRVLHERLLDPLGLSHTKMDEEVAPSGRSTHPDEVALAIPAGVRAAAAEDLPELRYEGTLWSAGGLFSTVDDLTRWALALWDRDGAVVSAETRDEMTTFLGPEFQYAGLGTYPFCPCWTEGDRIRGERWGHLGRTGELEYDPEERVALAIYTNETVLDEAVIVAYDDLSKRLRDAVRGRELPPLGTG